MERKNPSYRPLFYTMGFTLLAAFVVIYINLGDSQRTVPKIKVSYFKNNAEFVNAIELRLQQELKDKNYFWMGYEPEKENQLELLKQFKEKVGPFDLVILDKELNIKIENTHEIPLKFNFADAAKLIAENKDKRILVVTAAIYSTNFISGNPMNKITSMTQVRPMTFSLGYFPRDGADERYNLFKCDTEDKTGTSPWGCAVLNKARAVRRKINPDKSGLIGLMDLTGETDYMVLVGK